MEFPELGKQCSVETCRKLDFLPVKCDACGNIFCHDHMSYKEHQCREGISRDFQVPVCPLCNQPVPSKRGQAPDIAVGAHIDSDCRSDKKHKIFSNKCSVKNCRQKEVIRVICRECKLNYCLKHRHVKDHNCQGKKKPNMKNAPDAAKTGQTQRFIPANRPVDISGIQGNLTEDEAVARAMALSLQESNRSSGNHQNCRVS